MLVNCCAASEERPCLRASRDRVGKPARRAPRMRGSTGGRTPPAPSVRRSPASLSPLQSAGFHAHPRSPRSASDWRRHVEQHIGKENTHLP